MSHDSQPLERLKDLEDQLSQLQHERDQLKRQIEADKIKAIQNVQPLLEKINDRLKLHGFIVGIDDLLCIYLDHRRDSYYRFTFGYVETDELEKALNIIDRHIKFVTTVTSAFVLYKSTSYFNLDLAKQLLTFDIISDSYSIRFTYDYASETASAYAYATRNRTDASFTFGNVTMTVDAKDKAVVHYSLKTQTYTENLDQITALYNQVKEDMLTTLSKLSI